MRAKKKTKPKAKTKSAPIPKRHHIDRRAEVLAEGDDDDVLISTRELCEWLTVSYQWATIGRSRGWGPKFVLLTPWKVVYRKGDVRAWLRTRTFGSTAEHQTTR